MLSCSGPSPSSKTYHFIGFVFLFFNLSVYTQIHRAVGRLAGTHEENISRQNLPLPLSLISSFT